MIARVQFNVDVCSDKGSRLRRDADQLMQASQLRHE
jgi:hypothetical protein